MEKSIIKKFNIIAIICIVIFCVTISQKGLQNDTFYTIKLGEHIVETKSIDMKDPFSWHEGLTYTYPHWLYDTSIYLIYNLGENVATSFNIDAEQGGMTAVYISTMIFASILGVLIYRTNVKINNNYIVSFFLTLGVIFLLKDFIAARAQLVSYIFFTLEILFIEQFLKTKKKRYAIGLFIIATLIANCHAAVWYLFFILALPYIGEYFIIKLIESNWSYKFEQYINKKRIKRIESKITKTKENEKIEKLQAKMKELNEKNIQIDEQIERSKVAIKRMQDNAYKIETEKRKNIGLLIIILIICAFFGLLTPQTTFEPYTHMIKLLMGNTTANISEHLPIVLVESLEGLAIITIVITLLTFADTKITFKDLFMIGGLTILMLMSRRQQSILALIGVYSLNRIIMTFIQKYDTEGLDNKLMKKIVEPYGCLVMILLAIWCGVSFYGNKNEEEYISKEIYPVEATQYILDNIDIENMKIYNHYNFGSYLLYKDIPVFIDSRCDLYSPEFNEEDIFSDALNIAGLGEHYDDKFKEYGVTHIITNEDSKLKMLLERDEKYNKLYEDDNFWIFERVSE